MKKRVPRLKNRARRPFLGVRTTIAASLSPSLTAPTPFGVTMRLRLATPTGLAVMLSPYIVGTPRFARLLPDKTLARTLLYNTLDAAWRAAGDSRVGDMQKWEKYVSF